MTKERENSAKTSSAPESNETLPEIKERHRHEIRLRIEKALVDNDWSQTQAAQELECSKSTLRNLIDANSELRQKASSRTWPGRRKKTK